MDAENGGAFRLGEGLGGEGCGQPVRGASWFARRRDSAKEAFPADPDEDRVAEFDDSIKVVKL